MHEVAVVSGLLDIIRQEMARHGAKRLISATVRHGALANIVPDAMLFAFEAMTSGTDLDGARLELETEPLRLACFGCGKEFEPENPGLAYMPCPHCGEEFGHQVLSGKELDLIKLEAE